MQHRSTPLCASADATLPTLGPSLKTICMLQMLARTYQPETSKESRLNKHSLA